MPEEVLRADTYEEVREQLVHYAELRESEERGRTHYRCRVSFEREVDPKRIQTMTGEWLREALPKAKAVVFVHHDKRQLHAHLWLDARQVDGKKIDLSPRQFRQLDEIWNRIYSREMGRPEREHLEKKAEMRAYKRARARGEEARKPERAKRLYDPEQKRSREGSREPLRGTTPGEKGERSPSSGEQAARECIASSERTVRAVIQVREEFTRVGERAKNIESNGEKER